MKSTTERTKGLVLVHAGIEEANYPRARRLILRQLDELREGVLDAAQLEQARGMYLGAVRALRDSPQGLIGFAVERAVNGLPADPVALEQAAAAVGPGDIARAARTVELDTVFLLGGTR